METAEFKELLNRYREGKATTEEVAWLESWYMDLGKAENVVMDEAELIEARELIWKQVAAEHQMVPVKRRLWPRIAVAAAAVAAIVVGVWFFNYRGEIASVPRNDVAQNDIAPGKNGATITLANGKVIQLSDAKSGVVVGQNLKYNDGAAVQGGGPELYRSSTAQADDVMQLTASTAKAQTYQFTLPDGTKVWLNADSKISFPSQFIEKERKILLEGEGYFEVAKDKAHPFIVQTKRQQIEVLGTHFNVSAYTSDVATKTTLFEGKVAVTGDGDGSRLTLHPGDQAYSGLDGVRAKTLLDPEEEIDWKKGDFIFRNEALESIMSRVSRWYDVEVVYAPGVDRMQSFSGTVSRSKPVSAILGIIQVTKQVKFKIEGRKVYVE